MDGNATTIHDKTNEIMDDVIELIGNMYSDLTGKFPFKYFIVNRYTVLIYYYDWNNILTKQRKIIKENQSSMHMKYYTTS